MADTEVVENGVANGEVIEDVEYAKSDLKDDIIKPTEEAEEQADGKGGDEEPQEDSREQGDGSEEQAENKEEGATANGAGGDGNAEEPEQQESEPTDVAKDEEEGGNEQAEETHGDQQEETEEPEPEPEPEPEREAKPEPEPESVVQSSEPADETGEESAAPHEPSALSKCLTILFSMLNNSIGTIIILHPFMFLGLHDIRT